VDGDRLAERYTEAGLVFGVSPELLMPSGTRAIDTSGLTRAVDALPLEQRQVLTLYFEDSLSFPEIAQALELSPTEAQELYGRAATTIRARVSGTGHAAGGRR
jgi:DNA-directed RNA polymerase specialized sigma24 family protein